MHKPPVIILFETQLGENIGTTARAMHNFALKELRLAKPRSGYSQAKAEAAAAEAAATSGVGVLAAARHFDNLPDGLADLDYVIGATARPRDMNKSVLTPEQAAKALLSHKRAGVLFGAERSGLDNESLSLCDEIVEIPANPKFSSLNLAQAVLLICYHYYQAANSDEAPLKTQAPDLASKNQLLTLFQHLENELDRVAFFRSKDKRPIMVRNLRNIFQRAHLSEAEVKALRGVITALVDERNRRK